MRAEIARRFTKDAFERAVELRQRLKADVICDFADAEIRVQQSIASIFETHTRDVIGKLQSRSFVENFAEMKNARAGSLCHIG